MKNRIPISFAIIIISLVGLVFACKKDNSSKNSNENTVQTQADDQTMISDEADNIANDADVSLTSQTATNGNSAIHRVSDITTVMGTGRTTRVDTASTTVINDSLICDARVAIDTASNPITVTITYNGTNCWGNRSRTGKVIITIPAGIHWKDAGATVSVYLQDVKIIRARDGKTVTLNGVRTMTNVSGGSLIDLASVGTITHSLIDSFRVSFDNNTVRAWQTAQQRVFTYDNGVVITTTGTHTDGNTTGIAAWGTNRFGTDFEGLITQPLVIRQDCNFRLTSGQVQILRSDSLNSTITYGLDASGSPTTCPGLLGIYYFQIVWSFPNGKTVPIIWPY